MTAWDRAVLPAGWLTADEADLLRHTAQGLTVLELGAWQGRSTVVFAEVARYVVSVDRHQGIDVVGGEDSLPDYLTNVRGLPNVAVVVAAFEDVTVHLANFDLVYIDGDHDAVSVERDIGLAVPLEPPLVAFHDWDFTDVRATASPLMQACGYTMRRSAGSVAVWQR